MMKQEKTLKQLMLYLFAAIVITLTACGSAKNAQNGDVPVAKADETQSEAKVPQTATVNPQSAADAPQTDPETMPEFPGGTTALMQYLVKNMKYPVECMRNGTQGKVIVSFIVDTDGSIKDIELVNSVDKLLDAEAMRLISNMPKWNPGTQRGKPVRVKYTLPINFKLN